MTPQRRFIYRRKYLYLLIILFLLVYFTHKSVLLYKDSFFYRNPQRVNIVVYDKETTYYSFDTTGDRHYAIIFYPDLKVEVPGGYGSYRVGSLGKLASLGDDPAIIQRALSFATGSFIHGVFYENREEVYYGKEIPNNIRWPQLNEILTHQTDLAFFDRLFVMSTLINAKDKKLNLLQYREGKGVLHSSDIFFQSESFVKNSIGLLYQQQYRKEQKNIQIQYRERYAAAQVLSTLLEGNGIRVNDLLQIDDKSTFCRVIEDSDTPSYTAKDITDFFQCTYEKGKTDIYDIIFLPGKNIEEAWDIQ